MTHQRLGHVHWIAVGPQIRHLTVTFIAVSVVDGQDIGDSGRVTPLRLVVSGLFDGGLVIVPDTSPREEPLGVRGAPQNGIDVVVERGSSSRRQVSLLQLGRRCRLSSASS